MQTIRNLPSTTRADDARAARAAQRALVGSDVIVGVLLIAIMLIGGWLRYDGLNWDDYTHLHPDERFLTQVVSSINSGYLSPAGSDEEKRAQTALCLERYPDTAGIGGYFDARCSPLNPHNVGYGLYVYGTLPLFIARGTAELFVPISEWWAREVTFPQTGDPMWENYNGSQWVSYDGIHLVWRFMSAVAEIGCIVIAFLIGRRLHDKWVGLLAAALYSVTVFSIQMAHFGTVDAMSNFFAALSLLFAVSVMRRGGLENYLGFGLAFGCAVASRINLVPLAGILMIGAFVWALPAFDGRMWGAARRRMIVQAVFGLILAGGVSIVCFRLFNPYAFMGPGVLNLSINDAWLSDLGTAQALVSGDVDSPPNFQWVSRAAYLFPLNNMILWGMGIAFGVAAWGSFAWALWRIVRGKPGALANILLVAWILGYFGLLGRQWVTTMRYFLPLYPALAVLAAWGLLAIARGAAVNINLNVNVSALRRAFGGIAVIGVVSFTALWALMFTNIYRNQLTRVQASHWVWENVPGDFAMRVDGAPAGTPLINIPINNENYARQRRTYDARAPLSSTGFTVSQSGAIDMLQVSVYDEFADPPRTEMLDIALRDADSGDLLAEGTLTHDFTSNGVGVTAAYSIDLTPRASVRAGERYILDVALRQGDQVTAGASISTMDFMALIEPDPPSDFAAILTTAIIPVTNCAGSSDDLVRRVTCYDEFHPTTINEFTAPADGTITAIHAPHLGDSADDPDAETLRFTISDAETSEVVATALISTDLVRDTHILGRAYDIPLDAPLTVREGVRYKFQVDLVEGAPIVVGGSVFTWEGAWDDPIPTKICDYPDGITLADDPPPGLIQYPEPCEGLDPWWAFLNGYEMNIVYEDVPEKRTQLIEHLDNSDYIAISSNRFYDTLSRNPTRWAMTNRYYDALFSGELGYELVAMFQETFELGGLRVSDQVLPFYDVPDWLNEFEAEEAFHVYDHPVVMIYRRSENYDPQVVRDILYSVPIARVQETAIYRACPDSPLFFCDSNMSAVIALSSDQADEAATQLRFSDEMRAIQFENGTWSDRFDADSPISTNPPISIAAWWGAVMLFGIAAFPLIASIFPRLADRGYGLVKFAGMFLVAWGTWFLSSVRVPVWSQAGIIGGLIVLFVIGVVVAARTKTGVIAFVRTHWRRLLIIELIAAALFAAFVLVRASNPDLWHPSFGGEKPMDFAYFNGVLRSTIFPPIDPWNAGGFINYYYFGFVIVGAPVLLLQIVPSVAYNLILPTLFALTGVGALSVAFNVVSSLRVKRDSEDEANADDADAEKAPRSRPFANPWLAGVVALLLAVVLGNLDTARVFLNGVARTGGYMAPANIEAFFYEEFMTQNNRTPEPAEYETIVARALNPSVGDQVRYELDIFVDTVTAIGRGFGALANGSPLSVGAERWFWGPSRIYAETPGVEGQAITEMPIFTYVYGDLHAHMISMPMQYLVLAFLLNEILSAGARRRKLGIAAAVLVGAITVGMLRATNTWDWITYLILGAAGLGFAWWLGERPTQGFVPFNRWALVRAALYVGGFVVVTFIAVMPFTTWFASAYSRVLPWEGGKAPLWAYLTIHGVFLFLLVSLLLWDTGRWLRANKVASLRGACLPLLLLSLLTLGVFAASVVLATRGYQVALIALPLLWWIVVLFMRQGQTRPVQFLLALTGLSLALTLGVEFVVLDGDIGRQNTVFKFYLQAWLMLSIVGGAAFAWLWRGSLRWNGGMRTAFFVPLALLLVIAAAFPIMAARGKAVFRFDVDQPFTLDGAAFMNYAIQYEGANELIEANPTLAPFPLSEDYALIRWLQDNTQGSPVIVEGLSDGTEYKWNARISIYTGLPSVIGWNWHQRQQRGLNEMGRTVELRAANVNAFYVTRNVEQAWSFLQWYDVQYIVVGRLERAYYPAESLAKFARMAEQGLLEVAFQSGESILYRVNQDAQLMELG
jgi:YYY domain-containing protein